MPTLPLHQGWAASQAMISTASSCSCVQIFIQQQPVGIAAAGDIDPGAGIALGGDPGMGLLVPRPRAVAPAIGDVF